MYVQYKVNVSENQMDTLKDAIGFKKGVTLLPKRWHQLDRPQTEGRRAQIRMPARQVAKNASYTEGFPGVLASLAALAIPLAACALLVMSTF